MKSSAPMTSTIESAISPTTSDERSRAVARLSPARIPLRRSPKSSERATCHAGAAPKSSPVATATSTVYRSTSGWIPMRIQYVGSSGIVAMFTRSIQAASTTPTTAPARASSTLSVSSWRTMRPRPAPIAVRTAISRLRSAARASIRFATFAHAMSSTKATAPSRRTISRRVAWSTVTSRYKRTLSSQFSCVSGYSCAKRAAASAARSSAWRTSMPAAAARCRR